MPAVSGTHAPEKGEGVEGLREWLSDTINAVSCRRGCKGQRQCEVVEKVTPDMLRKGEEGWTA